MISFADSAKRNENDVTIPFLHLRNARARFHVGSGVADTDSEIFVLCKGLIGVPMQIKAKRPRIIAVGVSSDKQWIVFRERINLLEQKIVNMLLNRNI